MQQVAVTSAWLVISTHLVPRPLSQNQKFTLGGMNEDVSICESYFLTHEIMASEWQGVTFQVAFCRFCGRYPWGRWDVVLHAARAEESGSWRMQEYYL